MSSPFSAAARPPRWRRLGTALTEEQIALLWKLHDEPILCFDGDAAGQRAQMRALERPAAADPGPIASPSVMPEGRDPDDVLRESGNDGFLKLLAVARALVDRCGTRLPASMICERRNPRADFWQEIRGQVRLIGNNQVRSAYGDEIESRIPRCAALAAGRGGAGAASSGAGAPATAGR